ncbi:hypothetical protein [Pseudomonas syringae group genomosp. 7]|nr:hypothetical protein [Pseudomonas syringae group genomosp. 7]
MFKSTGGCRGRLMSAAKPAVETTAVFRRLQQVIVNPHEGRERPGGID